MTKLKAKDIAVFAMLAAIMIASKKAMEMLPNIHLLAPMIVAITVVYKKRALYPLYIYVLLEGLLAGFSTWWIPYTYVWTVLWAVTMLVPKRTPKKALPFVYAAICMLHGLLFGAMFAPVQAIVFGLDFKAMLAWIAAGLSFDITHAISNLALSVLCIPIINVLNKIKTTA